MELITLYQFYNTISKQAKKFLRALSPHHFLRKKIRVFPSKSQEIEILNTRIEIFLTCFGIT